MNDQQEARVPQKTDPEDLTRVQRWWYYRNTRDLSILVAVVVSLDIILLVGIVWFLL